MLDPQYLHDRAKLASETRWKRARPIYDRKRRLHAALDRLIDAAAGDPDLLAKLETGITSGALLGTLENIYLVEKGVVDDEKSEGPRARTRRRA